MSSSKRNGSVENTCFIQHLSPEKRGRKTGNPYYTLQIQTKQRGSYATVESGLMMKSFEQRKSVVKLQKMTLDNDATATITQ